MSNKVYDRLKFIAQVVLPGLAVLYLGLAEIWGLPYGEAIAGTIILIDEFLGTILHISTKKYNAKLNKEVGLDDVE